MLSLSRYSARLLIGLGLPLSLCLGGGCGGDSNAVNVSGTVTLDGASVPDGNVVFAASGGKSVGSAGAEITGGKYHLVAGKLQPGAYQVRIYEPRKTGKQVPTVPPGGMMDEVIETIPARYNVTSTLRVELTQGENVHNFELTSEPKRASGQKKGQN